jgi:methionyl-tRNA synthetase
MPRATDETQDERKKFYVTTPIYYVNDKPHIGSAYPTIAADVLARLHRQLGEDVFFLAGTAEHGSKIAKSAEKAGMEPQAFVDQNSDKFEQAWKVLDISNDDFIRTTEERHAKAVNKFFSKLKDSGKVYEKEYEGLYCVGHESFIKESELVDGLCPDHKTKPEPYKEKNWFFKLSDYGQILTDLIEGDDIRIRPESRKNEMLSFIKGGLEDIAISRQNVKFALPLPWDESQTIWVWWDELFNYCTAVGYEDDPERFKRYWPADVHVVGKDILRFHSVIWPALLLAIGEKPPHGVLTNGFFTIDNQKISKSLGNVIDPVEWAEKYGADAVRYFVLREVPFGQDGDISEAKMKARYNGDLANGLGNLFSRTTNMVEKFLDGDVGEYPQSPRDLSEAWEAFASANFSEGLIKIWEGIAWANQLIDKSKPWELYKTDPDKVRELLVQLCSLLYDISAKLAPVMPETADKIRKALEAEKIVKAEPLFLKID